MGGGSKKKKPSGVVVVGTTCVRKWMAVCLQSLAGRELMLFFLIHARSASGGAGGGRDGGGGARGARAGTRRQGQIERTDFSDGICARSASVIGIANPARCSAWSSAPGELPTSSPTVSSTFAHGSAAHGEALPSPSMSPAAVPNAAARRTAARASGATRLLQARRTLMLRCMLAVFQNENSLSY